MQNPNFSLDDSRSPIKIYVENGQLWQVYQGAPSPRGYGHGALVLRKRRLGPDFFDEIERYIREEGGGCLCKLTTAFLTAIGAEFSAKMHAEPGREWEISEWLVHFAEEDEFVVPLQKALGFEADAEEIETDHARFRRQYERGIPWSRLEVIKHAQREDKMVERLVAKMRMMIDE
jgi:hypothetical protein